MMLIGIFARIIIMLLMMLANQSQVERCRLLRRWASASKPTPCMFVYMNLCVSQCVKYWNECMHACMQHACMHVYMHVRTQSCICVCVCVSVQATM